MLIVDTYLKNSDIQGIGVFSLHCIPQNTIIWKFDSIIDAIFDCNVVKKYNQLEKYHWKNSKGECIVPLDNDKYMNHSNFPNFKLIDDYYGIVVKDIEKNEELTIDYKTLIPKEEWEDYYE